MKSPLKQPKNFEVNDRLIKSSILVESERKRFFVGGFCATVKHHWFFALAHGRVPPQTTPARATYTDAVTVTVTY